MVSATSEKFSGAAKVDVLESAFDRIKAVDDDGAVKADAAENKVAVNFRAVKDFIVLAILLCVIRLCCLCNMEQVVWYLSIAIRSVVVGFVASAWHVFAICSWS